MKKVVTLLLMMATFIIGAATSYAEENSVITAPEQSLLDEGIRLGGKHVTPDVLANAENYLKSVDVTQEVANKVLPDMDEIYALIKSTGVNMSDVTNVDQAVALLRQHGFVAVADRVVQLVNEIESLLPAANGGGGGGNGGGGTVVPKGGSTSGAATLAQIPTTSELMKNTGRENLATIIVIAVLAGATAISAVVLGKRKHTLA
jgi:hypothetical protein